MAFHAGPTKLNLPSDVKSPILNTPDTLDTLNTLDIVPEERAPKPDKTPETLAEDPSGMPKYPPKHSPSAAPPLPRSRILALTSGLVGIQFCWAVQVGYVTKALLELGLPARYVSYAWLAGPIAGVFVQPIVGILSDRCNSRLGRRRPFLIFGSLIAALCILFFAYAAQIGVLLGDSKAEEVDEFVTKPRALLVAILAFWALDFAINAAQGPLRALLADVMPTSQHKTGNAYFALATGLGNCFGSLMGSVPLSKWWPIFPDDLQALYTFAALMLLGFMTVTVVFVKEKPLERDGYELLEGGYGGVAPSQGIEERGGMGFFKAATVAPYPFFETFLVQCFSWFGWFTMFVFATSWVGKEVYNGQFDAPKGSKLRELYDAGVRAGNLGIGLQSVLTIVFSLLLPAILERFSMGIVYFVSHLLMGTALCSALLLHHQEQAWIATTLLASTGFSWAVTMTIPWSLMSEAVSKKAPERAGIYFTMFNLSQCFPEIVVSLIAEEVERVTQSQAAVLGLGGMVVYVGGALIVLMRLGMRKSEEETVVKYTVDE